MMAVLQRESSSRFLIRALSTFLGCLLSLVGVPVEAGLNLSSPEPGPALRSSESSTAQWVSKKKRRRRKRRRKKKKAKETTTEASSDEKSTTSFDASAPTGEATGANAPAGGGVLDLTTLGTEQEEAAKEQLLLGEEESAEKKKSPKKKKKGGGFDFGGDLSFDAGSEIDFGIEEFDLGGFTLDSPERQRFDAAMALMSDDEFVDAAQEFRFFLEDKSFREFHQESEYQLAKALYKLGFLDPALTWYKKILEQGPAHRRYKKSIEWLFFIARKMADETPVLSELARFRNVTFPEAYRDEYAFLLAKYLFVQAQQFEVDRIRKRELERGKKSGAADFDFEQVVEAGVDFENVDFGDTFNFGNDQRAGGSFDFGSDDSENDQGSFDFGGGGFDFGGSGNESQAPSEAKVAEGPVREAAPQNAKEAIRQGLQFAEKVDPEGKFAPRAKYLEGLLKYLEGSAQESVSAFQEVVRLLNPRTGARLDPHLREMAFLSLARIHYGHQQFDRSVYYYDLIGRDSESWLTALFEASWGYYQRGDFEKALGNLLTLHSPFFEKEYFPESQIVKAIIYFEACRYEETRGLVDDFLGRYTKVMKEIERIAESKDSADQVHNRIETLRSISNQEDDDATTRVVNLALSNEDILRAREVVTQVDRQLNRWNEFPEAFRSSKVGRELIDELQKRKIERIADAGEVTRRTFEEELYALKSLLAQALRIKLEVARAERTSIEAKLRGESGADEIVPAVARTVVDDEHFYWPYEGEYWRDELGTYELDFSMCRPLAAR